MVNHLSQPERWHRRGDAIDERVRQQPLCGKGADFASAPPRRTEFVPHLQQPGDKRGRPHQKCAAGTSGCPLASTETENRDVSETSDTYAAQSSPCSLRGIFDNWNPVRSRYFLYGLDIGRISVEMGYHYFIYAPVDCLLYRFEVWAQCIWVQIVESHAHSCS